MRPLPNSTLPDSTTRRVPNRSDSAPQKKEAAPINRKSSVAAAGRDAFQRSVLRLELFLYGSLSFYCLGCPRFRAGFC